LAITLVASLGLHLIALTAALLLLHPVPVVDAPDKPTEVELVMEEHKGSARPTASPSAQSTSTPPPEKPVKQEKPDPAAAQTPPDKPVEKPAAEAPPLAAPTETTAADTPSPPTPSPVEARADLPKETPEPAKVSDPTPVAATPPAQEAKAAPEPAPPAPPTPPVTQTAPTITLSGTDSPSDARAWGDRIIPAAPDAVFHNRPPEFPDEAAMNGEHGTVILVIHITPAGTASGVDVTRSSGFVLLDRAAREAVLRWRFLPAVKDGQPVASDMTMGFVFDY
jgi:protein TonB